MIKRVIGTLAVLASLAVMVLTIWHRDEFSSMLFDEDPSTEKILPAPAAAGDCGEPAVPEEEPVPEEEKA